MALETNAYKSAAAATDDVIPTLYNSELQQYQYDREILRPLGTDVTSRIMPQSGNSLNVYKGTQMSLSSLSQGTDTPVSALDFDKVVLTVAEYGDAKQIPWDIVEDSFDFIVGDLAYSAAGAFAENNDAVIMTALNATTSTAVYPIKTGTTRYVTGDIIAGAGLTKEQFTEVKRAMRVENRVFKQVILHPSQEKDILDDDDFIDATNYPAGILTSGALGKIYGAEVFVHNSVTSATENTSITVYRAVALGDASGQKAFVFGYKRMPTMKFDDEYDRKRALTFHVHYRFGAKIVWNEGVIIMKSS